MTGVGIATDRGGFGLSEECVTHLRHPGHKLADFGSHKHNLDEHYPGFIRLARAV